MTPAASALPERFAAALQTLRRPQVRPEVVLREIPAPGRIAPYAVALEGEVVIADDELSAGRFIALHDPAGQEAWRGDFRVVTYLQATLEPEMAADPLLQEVAWSWVTEAVADSGLALTELGGTVTRVLSTSFGSLEESPQAVDLELRASWTPEDTDLGAHLRLWIDLMSTIGGLPPLPDGVTPLAPRRHWTW
ncbi:MAG: DUF3000 domain-containing protein [Promicromonosporaceae bacterium]|nr:DUF3000 domain-containing protein [Promicromonosporaceae bacterium]